VEYQNNVAGFLMSRTCADSGKQSAPGFQISEKLILAAHAPPLDIILVYDKQPGSSADDTITDPDYPAEAYF
jgi:hypothetical protein